MTPPQSTPRDTLGQDILQVLEKRISRNDCVLEILGLVHRSYGQPHEGTGEKENYCRTCAEWGHSTDDHDAEGANWNKKQVPAQDWRGRFENIRNRHPEVFGSMSEWAVKNINALVATEIEAAK